MIKISTKPLKEKKNGKYMMSKESHIRENLIRKENWQRTGKTDESMNMHGVIELRGDQTDERKKNAWSNWSKKRPNWWKKENARVIDERRDQTDERKKMHRVFDQRRD